jgi:hypothetical protein
MLYLNDFLTILKDCYLYITGKLSFFVKKSAFYVVLFGLVTISVAAETWRFPAYYPGPVTRLLKSNTTVGNTTYLKTLNVSYYTLIYTTFDRSVIYSSLNVSLTIFRDIFLCMVILVLNVLILLQMREMTKRRIRLTASGFTAHHQNDARTITAGAVNTTVSVTAHQYVRVALKAERKKSIMIVLTGVNYVTCHILFPFVLMINQFVPYILNASVLSCLFSITRSMTYAAYTTPFLFYYFFNTHFKRLTHRNLRFMFYPFVFVYRVLVGPRMS